MRSKVPRRRPYRMHVAEAGTTNPDRVWRRVMERAITDLTNAVAQLRDDLEVVQRAGEVEAGTSAHTAQRAHRLEVLLELVATGQIAPAELHAELDLIADPKRTWTFRERRPRYGGRCPGRC
jgi:hypothetical protein